MSLLLSFPQGNFWETDPPRHEFRPTSQLKPPPLMHDNEPAPSSFSTPLKIFGKTLETVHPFVKMIWETLAKEKRDSVNALIPKKWLVTSPVPSAAEQRDVTGGYIQQFLSPREIEITETDAVGITKNTTAGIWKAREVAEAFCHRAALAHQMVHNCQLGSPLETS